MAESKRLYQKILKSHLGGKSVKLQFGVTDVTTDSMHVEIKPFKKWTYGVGNLLINDKTSPRSELRLYLYDNNTTDIEFVDMISSINSANIKVYLLEYKNGNVYILDTTTNQIEVIDEIPPLSALQRAK